MNKRLIFQAITAALTSAFQSSDQNEAIKVIQTELEQDDIEMTELKREIDANLKSLVEEMAKVRNELSDVKNQLADTKMKLDAIKSPAAKSARKKKEPANG